MEWRNIPGHERRYQISDTGLVRSLPRAARDRTLKGKVLKTTNGRVAISRGGEVRVERVSDLLKEIFPELHQVEDDKEWRPVPGFEGYYEVSADRDVRRVSTGRVLKPSAYGHVNLSRPGVKQRPRKIEDLYREAFEGAEPTEAKPWDRSEKYVAPGKTAEDMAPYRQKVSKWIAKHPTPKAKRNREKLVKLYYEYRGEYRYSREFKSLRESLTEHQIEPKR